MSSLQRQPVFGVVMYYPHKGGVESKPVQRRSSATAEDRAEVSAEAPHTAHDGEFRDNNKLFSVLWQDRLVPDTFVSQLPFFPLFSSKAFFAKAGFSPSVQYRMKGFLFLSWNFKHISNNKLSIQMDPPLSDYLNSNPIKKQILLHPKDVGPKFLKSVKPYPSKLLLNPLC